MEESERFWDGVLRQMLIERLVTKDIENYGILKITPEGQKFLKKPYALKVAKDTDPEKGEHE